MVCKHCGRTLEEQDQYLMSRSQHAEIPGWLIQVTGIAIAFLLIVGVLSAQY